MVRNEQGNNVHPLALAPDRDVLAVLCVSWLVRAAYLVATRGMPRSYDMHYWNAVSTSLLAGQNPYATTSYLNWPPFWMQMIHLVQRMGTGLGLSLDMAVAVTLIAAESLLIVAMHRLLRRLAPGRSHARLLMFGIALNPVALLLVCQHCNFDVFVALAVVMFAGCLSLYRDSDDPIDWLCAAGWLGLAILIKTVPLILLPLLLPKRDMPARARYLGALLALGPVTLGMSIIYVLSPAAVQANVIGYRSGFGFFGLSGILQSIAPSPELRSMYSRAFIAIAGVFILWAICNRNALAALPPRKTILMVLLLMVAVPTLGPYHACQYADWYLPLLVITIPLLDRRWRTMATVTLVVMAITYIVLYMLRPDLGAVLVYVLRTDRLITLSKAITGNGHQTALTFPMFLCLLALLALGIRRLRSPVATPAVPGSGIEGITPDTDGAQRR